MIFKRLRLLLMLAVMFVLTGCSMVGLGANQNPAKVLHKALTVVEQTAQLNTGAYMATVVQKPTCYRFNGQLFVAYADSLPAGFTWVGNGQPKLAVAILDSINFQVPVLDLQAFGQSPDYVALEIIYRQAVNAPRFNDGRDSLLASPANTHLVSLQSQILKKLVQQARQGVWQDSLWQAYGTLDYWHRQRVCGRDSAAAELINQARFWGWLYAKFLVQQLNISPDDLIEDVALPLQPNGYFSDEAPRQLFYQGQYLALCPSWPGGQWLATVVKPIENTDFSYLKQLLMANGWEGDMPRFLNLDDKYTGQIEQLNAALVGKGVPDGWLYANLNHPGFELYEKMPGYFGGMAEHKVTREERDHNWYRRHFGLDRKKELAKDFVAQHKQLLLKAQAQNGVPYQVVVGILGMETNFAQKRHRGSFTVFGSLVSQWLLMDKRKNFAERNLDALYKFSQKTGKDVYYFVGSFAGASGWGQFIPTSQLAFFVDANGDDKDIDIYSVEDNVFSIQNYLYNHGLNAATANSQKAKEKAVFAYNRSDSYVKAVLEIAESLTDNK